MIYSHFIKPILFHIHPDYAHTGITFIGHQLGKYRITRKALDSFFVFKHPALESTVCGVHFQNPVGLAGGFDKDCMLIQTMPHIGFGFMEVGSITRHPYAGNRRPWSVRLPKDESLVINYGLKNKGALALQKYIAQQKREIPLVINIAKTNNPSIKGSATIQDYIESFQILQPLADLININISCPNTGDGVLLCEDMNLLAQLLDALEEQRPQKPIFLKIKPDISDETLATIVRLVQERTCIRGFIISNLSKQRTLLSDESRMYAEPYAGGISGRPIRNLSTDMISKVYTLTQGSYPIIGLGGIFSAQDAYQKVRAGASLVELITGMVYKGPSLIKEINRGLVELLKKDGFSSISQAVGADHYR